MIDGEVRLSPIKKETIMPSELSRREFLHFTAILAAGCCGMGTSFPFASSKECGLENTKIPSSKVERFFMDGGLLEFNYEKKNIFLYKGDIVEFTPTVKILHFHSGYNSGIESPIHIIDNIYEFTFMPLERYLVPRTQSSHNNCYHYLVNIVGMFNVFHFNFIRQYESYLKLNTIYSGFGIISNTEKPWDCNQYISKNEVLATTITGHILSITNSMPYYCHSEDGFEVRPYPHDLSALKRIAAKYKKAREEVLFG
jgi:hypothetical protein